MIAFVRGDGRRGHALQRRPRGRRGRPRAHLYAGHAGHAAHRPGRDAADQHGRARGLADAVRLPRRGREGRLRARADRVGRRPQARPGDARRAQPRRPAPRGRGRGRQDADQGPRDRPEGAPSGSSSSSGTGSAGPVGVRHATAPAHVDTWRDQVHHGLTGLGWPAREADSAVDAVADQAGDAPDVGALLRAALQTLSRA